MTVTSPSDALVTSIVKQVKAEYAYKPKHWRRKGKFYITMEVVEEGLVPVILQNLTFTPCRVECLAYRGSYEYIGTSPLFDEVPEGNIIPEYQVTCHNTDGKFDSVTVDQVSNR